MFTNDIKKGMKIKLDNGWYGTMMDNMKGNTRVAEVEGFFTEIGSVYAHEIVMCQPEPPDGKWEFVEHTDAQKKLKKTVSVF